MVFDKNNILTLALNNELVCQVVPSNSKLLYCRLTVKYGALYDGTLPGKAHFLEHLLLEVNAGNRKTDKYFLGGATGFEQTTYTLICSNDTMNLYKAIDTLFGISIGSTIENANVEKVRQDIIQEYVGFTNTLDSELFGRLVVDSNLHASLPIGHMESIKQITFEDVRGAFNEGYHRKSMRLFIVGADVTACNHIKNYRNSPIGSIKNADSVRITEVDNKSVAEATESSQTSCDIFILSEKNNYSYIYTDLLDCLALTLIEELIITQSKLKLTHDNISTSMVKYSHSHKYYRVTLLKDKLFTYGMPAFCLLDSLVLNNETLDIIGKILSAYTSELEKHDVSEYSILRHLSECFVYGQPMYDNTDLLLQLFEIHPSDVLIYTKNILKSNKKFHYYLGEMERL